MKRLFYVLTGLCLLAGVFTGCEKETEKTGTIKGVVIDEGTGNPISGVTIELQPTGKQVKTDQYGNYTIGNLKVGTYTLKAQREGYIDYMQEEIQVVANQTLRLNIKMNDEKKAESDYTVTILGLNMEMVYVEGGEFKMGATEEQGNDARANESPVLTVKLDSYHIGKYEVTQTQWKAVMGTEPSHFKGGDFPVENVSWFEAQEFCKKLSEATGRKYVLPTEAQWEYAARGGNKSQHFKYAGSNNINDVAWYKDYSDSQTHSVGVKNANELGIYDMSGNVAEWCSVWLGRYDANDIDNPQGPTSGTARVARGGGWSDVARYCRVSDRYSSTPYNHSDGLGFRVVCVSE
ncbi:MAG: SUMF1/EgtB/PvdO family nonheme iron enzyme [Bacteroidales bacterium]|nr:SUMF1/EgtB/PvdO family nonheme iron enzyme [Bacteroidales bacterium]